MYLLHIFLIEKSKAVYSNASLVLLM